MTHRIEIQPSAQRNLNRLSGKIRDAALTFIYGPLAENPQQVGKPLRHPFDGQYGTRRGSYRIRYRIVEDRVLVEVISVAHRADIYRP